MNSKLIYSKPVVTEGPDLFLDWQLADELASAAEKLVVDGFTSLMSGAGLHPSDIQMQVALSLRSTATARLKRALAQFEPLKGA